MTENATRTSINLPEGSLDLGRLGTRRLDYDALGQSLGNLCVLQGQTARFFSLAELALSTIPLVPENDMLHALLYPSPATIIGDIAPEARDWFGGHVLTHLQEQVREAIYEHLGISPPTRIVSEHVRQAHEKKLAEVESQLLHGGEPVPEGRLLCLPPAKAAKAWIRATELMMGEQLEDRLNKYYRIMNPSWVNASEH